VSTPARARLAVAALFGIVVVTISWWALALWPVEAGAPEWLLLTREVCFGATADSLPTTVGWMLLIGQPAGMVLLLAVGWGRELRTGMAVLVTRFTGQAAVGVVSALMVAGLGATINRVRTAGTDTFSTGAADLAQQLTRISDPAPALTLTDQAGRELTLASFRGRPVIVTFAFAHCQTVCPVVVEDVLAASRQAAGQAPVVLVVTLDPWRDTPSRLPSIARAWRMGGDAHVLSGDPESVERTLNAWRIPRTRNQKNGDILHPTIVYVIDAGGRVTYAVNGGADVIAAALRAL
jgi:protein SCO1/2